MRNIWAIISKEFVRFFTDKRMIIGMILPAILIYVLYSLMGIAFGATFGEDDEHDRWLYAVNMPVSIEGKITALDITIMHIQEHEVESVKGLIVDREIDLLAIFPRDFDAVIEVFDVQTATVPVPNIELYFNSAESTSHAAYIAMVGILRDFEASFTNKFDVNRDKLDADLATAEDISARVIASLMPMILMTLLFSGCMGLALESIAGEKERGTIATLLVSPLKRSELAIGKILSLAVLSFLSGAIVMVATIFALPRLMGGGDVIGADIYSLVDYLYLGIVILTTVLLMVAMISIISTFAKTVKEAGMAVTPLMFVVMLVGVSGMFGGGVADNPLLYIIPLYGSVQAMSGIFALDYSVTNVLIASISTFFYACVGGFVLTRLFNSEKVMFSK